MFRSQRSGAEQERGREHRQAAVGKSGGQKRRARAAGKKKSAGLPRRSRACFANRLAPAIDQNMWRTPTAKPFGSAPTAPAATLLSEASSEKLPASLLRAMP